jgi:hypothetical protein
MAAVTNELIFEILRPVQRDLTDVKAGVGELKVELHAMRGHIIAVQQDIGNIYATLVRHEQRLDRIEQRLEISEVDA